ncbi:coiled-coil domain-containing protein [Legionella sp. WA2024007413]
MIQVNVWLSTTQILGKRIKNRFFGPLLASEDKGEHIGHANFVMELNEHSPGFAKLEDKSSILCAKKSLCYVPEAIVGQSGRYYKRKALRSVQVTHSFWPEERPSSGELFRDFFNLLHLAPKAKGTKPEISDHDSDMKREDSNSRTLAIEHPAYRKKQKKIDDAKRINLDATVKVWNIDGDIDNRRTAVEKLNQLIIKQQNLILSYNQLVEHSQTELDALKKTKNEIAAQVLKNTKKTIFPTRLLNYLNKITKPDAKTIAEIFRLTLELNDLQKENETLNQALVVLEKNIEQTQINYQAQLKTSQEELDQTAKEIILLQSQIQELNQRINGMDETAVELLKANVRNRADFLSRKENLLLNSNKTEGKHPEHSIQLPTSESGLRYHINELAVINAMEKESNESYCFIQNNCAKSVKRCLLAGIQHLKAELKKNGVSDSFFKPQAIETTNGVYKWARSLERELNKLNSRPEAEIEVEKASHRMSYK